MAKEYPGILLCLACVMRSAKGGEMLNKKETFRSNGRSGLQDWITLVETLLQWEMWLKSDYMQCHHVQKARRNICILCTNAARYRISEELVEDLPQVT